MEAAAVTAALAWLAVAASATGAPADFVDWVPRARLARLASGPQEGAPRTGADAAFALGGAAAALLSAPADPGAIPEAWNPALSALRGESRWTLRAQFGRLATESQSQDALSGYRNAGTVSAARTFGPPLPGSWGWAVAQPYRFTPSWFGYASFFPFAMGQMFGAYPVSAAADALDPALAEPVVEYRSVGRGGATFSGTVLFQRYALGLVGTETEPGTKTVSCEGAGGGEILGGDAAFASPAGGGWLVGVHVRGVRDAVVDSRRCGISYEVYGIGKTDFAVSLGAARRFSGPGASGMAGIAPAVHAFLFDFFGDQTTAYRLPLTLQASLGRLSAGLVVSLDTYRTRGTVVPINLVDQVTRLGAALRTPSLAGGLEGLLAFEVRHDALRARAGPPYWFPPGSNTRFRAGVGAGWPGSHHATVELVRVLGANEYSKAASAWLRAGMEVVPIPAFALRAGFERHEGGARLSHPAVPVVADASQSGVRWTGGLRFTVGTTDWELGAGYQASADRAYLLDPGYAEETNLSATSGFDLRLSATFRR